MQNENRTELVRQPVPRVSFDAPSGDAGRQAFDMWHELCRPAFDTAPNDAVEKFQVDFDWYNLDGLVFSWTKYSAMQFHRTAQHVENAGADLVVLHLLLRGREDLEVADRPVVMAPDRIVLVDWSYTFTRQTTAVEQYSIGIPRHLLPLGQRLCDLGPVLQWGLNSAAGNMLANAMTSVWAGIPNCSQRDASQVSSGFLGLLSGLIEARLGDAPDPYVIRPAMLAAMKSYLMRRLANPSLGAHDLVKAFRCSRSTVYRLFQGCGGVNAFIREQRLVGCMRALKNPRRTTVPLSEIAHAWGFDDAAYFHRIFKKRFGLTPGEAARLGEQNQKLCDHAKSTDPPPNVRTIHQWLGIAAR